MPADDAPGAAPVIILSYRFWQGRLAKHPDVVGSTVAINGMPTAVIGVMPERFDFPEYEDFWMPVAGSTAANPRAAHGYFMFGRLRDRATRQEARAELDTIDRRLEATYPARNRGVILGVERYSQFFIGPEATSIYGSLWAAAWLVLLIACGNLANLQLARTIGRWRDFATRIALGAGPWRMVRQVLIESLMLAAVAGTIAWGITVWSVRTWSLSTQNRYVVLDYGLSAGTAAYLAGIAVVAACLYSLAPIIRVVQLGVDSALHGDARGVTQSLRAKRLTAGLVLGQMALAIILLSGAGVLVRSLFNIVHAQTGVPDREHILVGAVHLPPDKYLTTADRLTFVDRLEARLRALPAVAGEAVASTIPANGATSRALEIQGRATPQEGRARVSSLTVSPDYFHVTGTPLIAGRDFNDNDRAAGLPVAIVNDRFASTFWPGEQAVGQLLRLNQPNGPGEWRTVVGVAPNIMQDDATRQTFRPIVYLPFRQGPAVRAWSLDEGSFNGTYFLLRADAPQEQIAHAVRATVEKLDPDVTVQDVESLKGTFRFHRGGMDLEHAELGKNAAVAPILAGIALILAVVGLYAVIAHSVSQRTKEIGLRIAIGAQPREIRRLVFGEGLWPVACGIALGLASSLAVNRILRSQLVGVSPYDPVTMAAALAVLSAVALLACHIPARRATRVDPVVALRHE